LTLTFKLVRARDQTRLPCELGANPFSGSRGVRVTNNKNSAVAEMGDRGHNRHGPKRERVAVPFRGKLGPRLISLQCGLGRGLPPYQVASIHPSSRMAMIINMNRKLGAVCLLGGAATPSNTTAPGLTFTSVPSGILIHPAVWSQ